jgi:hypothetical protein
VEHDNWLARPFIEVMLPQPEIEAMTGERIEGAVEGH